MTFNEQEFRRLTERVFAAEKPGFWSDWTSEQQDLYMSGDWKAFSRSRGYTESEIAECDLWLTIIEQEKANGRNALACVADLCNAKAQENLRLDTRGEILISTNFPTPRKVRDGMMRLEGLIKKNPLGQGPNDFPLKHTFVDGLYMRESFVPAGYLFTTRIHKVDHAMFLLEGEASVLTDNGFKRIVAPYHGITRKGTKRIVLTHTDTVCVTVHPTRCTTVEDVEAEIFADTFQEIGIDCQEVMP